MAQVSVPLNTININDFINRHPAGTTFKFLQGTYRFKEGIVARTRDEFVGTEVAGQRVSKISGAIVLSKWHFQKNCWWANAPIQEQEITITDVCLPDSPSCIYPNDLFMDDVLKKRVISLQDVRPGTWYFDYTNKRAYVGDNPHGKYVEISSTPYFYSPPNGQATEVLAADLIVEKYAAATGTSGLSIGHSPSGSNKWQVRSCEVRYNHGGGIGTDAESLALYNYVHHNGGFGFTGAGWDILIEGNEICYNNTCDYNPYWGAGGSKWVWTTNLILRGNFSHHNKGPGLWTDINNKGVLYEYNICEDNYLSGIFHEIGYEGVIRFNNCRRNGLERAWPWWTANAGISVVSSRNVEVHNNFCEDNWQEITGLNDHRGNGNDGPWELENFRVHHNQTINRMPNGIGAGRTGVVSELPFLFDYNQYLIGENVLPFFLSHPDANLDWQGWQARGQDHNGIFGRI